jgi:hypothetical protein
MANDPSVSRLAVPVADTGEELFKVRTQCPACGHAYKSYIPAGHIELAPILPPAEDTEAVKAAVLKAHKGAPPPKPTVAGPNEAAEQRAQDAEDDAAERKAEDKAESLKAKKGKH